MPEIEPAPATRVSIPAIGVDAAVVPVDSTPTGKTNAWGGPIYAAIDFPVDAMVRQWVRRGSPNSLPADASAGRAAAFDRVVLYGHASDIGRRLTFQDLSSMRIGETVTVTTRLGRFTYQVFNVITGAKATLNNLPELYGYPSGGAKELALVACLPDTTSNVVVLAQLIGAAPVR